MSAGAFFADILSAVVSLPNIVFSEAFAVVVTVVFSVGFFVKLIIKAVV